MIRTADVVVAGGGLIGCAVARELARRGARTVVVERGEVGEEASRAAAGMVAPQAECERRGPVLTLGVLSRARYGAWVAAVEAESGIDVEYCSDGILYVALTPGDERVLAARARWQRAAGLRVRRLGLGQARRLVPSLARPVRAVLHFPDDHRVNNEGLFYATGHYRSGILLAPVTAEAIADLVLSGHTALPLRGMSAERFAHRG